MIAWAILGAIGLAGNFHLFNYAFKNGRSLSADQGGLYVIVSSLGILASMGLIAMGLELPPSSN